MWNRMELKARGKAAYKANYWKSVLVAFLATIATGAASTASRSAGSSDDLGEDVLDIINGLDTTELLALLGITAGIFIIVLVFSLALNILVLNPLGVGTSGFFIENRVNHEADLDLLSRGFKENYKNVITVGFMKDLFIALWSLLFLIPGVIKAYQYYLVDYLLAENPDMPYNEALETSKKLMDGQKWQTFVLDLSFIGWYILGSLTFGIVNLLYTQPYMEATHAELFMALAHPENANPMYDENGEQREVQTVEFVVEETKQQ